jgi:fatty-acyl-CoA synthase
MGLTPDGLSYWTADTAGPGLIEVSMGALLDEAARLAPNQQAVVVDGFADHGFDVTWTYADFRDRSDAVARGLIAAGIRSGDRVGLWAPNVAEWLSVEFGVAKVGAVLVPLNPTYRAAEAHYALAETRARMLFLLPRIRTFAIAEEFAQLAPLDHLGQVVSLAAETPPGMAALTDFIAAGRTVTDLELAERLAAVQPQSPAQIQFTSGTTGKPKGAVLTHHSLINDARQFAHRWQVTASERWANPMPLFHTAGCAMVTLGCIANQATQVLSVWFDADRLIGIIERQHCTIVETVPTMVTALQRSQRANPADLTSLRLVGTGGAPVTAELGRGVVEVLGSRLRAVYGLTETSPLIAAAPCDPPASAAGAENEFSWTTAGPPLGHVEVQIRASDGPLVTVGELGEIWVRGFLVMQGYLNQPEATAQTIDADGWLRTGDVGRFTEHGWVQLVDRIKDIIIRGGENLYPAEIESLVAAHPGVYEVCVVGIPDAYYGEEACAVVRLREGAELSAEQLRSFVRAVATHQKVPRHVLFTDTFPVTGSGKIIKREVALVSREQLAAQVGE